jgi:hypothetical protein
VDPSQKSARLLDPQSWNRYSYALNNPLVYVDRNGKWPQSTHELIIDTAFPGLSDHQRQVLKDASARLDNPLRGGQNEGNSYQHFMRAPSESVDQARTRTFFFVAYNEYMAGKMQKEYNEKGGKGLSDKALDSAGEAIHPMTDKTSPAHTDEKGDPRVWDLSSGRNALGVLFGDLLRIRRHNKEEESISLDQMKKAVEEAQESYRRSFGDAALQQAIKHPKAEKDKTQRPDSEPR